MFQTTEDWKTLAVIKMASNKNATTMDVYLAWMHGVTGGGLFQYTVDRRIPLSNYSNSPQSSSGRPFPSDKLRFMGVDKKVGTVLAYDGQARVFMAGRNNDNVCIVALNEVSQQDQLLQLLSLNGTRVESLAYDRQYRVLYVGQGKGTVGVYAITYG